MVTSYLIFTTAPFHIGDIPLGTLVPDVRYPAQDSLTIFPTLPKEYFSKRPQQCLKGDLDSEKNRSFKAQLTKLFTLSAAKRKSANLTLNAEKGWLYELKQPKALFKEICGKEEVRVWLREGLESQQDSHFVVGLRTFEHASVGEGAKSATVMKAGGSVPVGDIVKANTGVSPGKAADVKGKIDVSDKEKAHESFDTEEEMVYAIEYRKIVMKKREPDAPRLDGDNVWRYYSDNRTAGLEGEYEEYTTTLDEDEIKVAEPFQRVENMDGETLLLPIEP